MLFSFNSLLNAEGFSVCGVPYCLCYRSLDQKGPHEEVVLDDDDLERPQGKELSAVNGWKLNSMRC